MSQIFFFFNRVDAHWMCILTICFSLIPSPNEPIFSHQPHMDTFYLPNNFYHHSNWNWNSSLKWIWRHEIKGGSLINNVITWGIVYHEHQPKYQAKVLNSFAHVFVWFWSNIIFCLTNFFLLWKKIWKLFLKNVHCK